MAKATHLADGLVEAIGSAGVDVQVPRVGPLLGIFFADAPVRNYDDAKAAADNGRYAPFFHAMLDQGVALAPGPYEAAFPSLAHSVADIDRTIEAAARRGSVAGLNQRVEPVRTTNSGDSENASITSPFETPLFIRSSQKARPPLSGRRPSTLA